MSAGLADLERPDWLLAGFDAAHDVYQFARISQRTYRDSAFLDHRIRPRPEEIRTLMGTEVDRLLAAARPEPAGWIVHTAFCCSTLLAFCLDHEGQTLVLREPAVLSRLAATWRQPAPRRDTRLADRVLRLAERRYGSEHVIVKPSNYANALLPVLLAPRPDGRETRRCLLLSCALRELLLSVLKKRQEAERLLPSFTEALLADSDYREQVDLPPIGELALLQQGVVFWHCQRHHIQTSLARAARPLAMGMTMERFLAEPVATLSGISAFFGLGLDEATVSETIGVGAFRQHAKAGMVYGPEERRREAEALAARYSSEINAVLAWARPLLDALPVEPLVPGEDPVGA